MASHSGQFTPGGYLITVIHMYFGRHRTHNLLIVSPTSYCSRAIPSTESETTSHSLVINSNFVPLYVSPTVFTARCTLVQSAVLRSHVVCLSVCPSVCLSVTLVNCDHIRWNSSKIISSLVSLGCSLFATPTWRICSKVNTLNYGPK